jgi:hypothetical protein
MGPALQATAVKGIFVSQALARGLQSQKSFLAQVAMGVREIIASLTQRQDSLCPKDQAAVRLAMGVKVVIECRQSKLLCYELLKTTLKLSRSV